MHRSREAGRIGLENHLSRPGDFERYPASSKVAFDLECCCFLSKYVAATRLKLNLLFNILTCATSNNLYGTYLQDRKMKNRQYEYKIYYLAIEVGRDNEEQILEALNDFGKDGWRLNRLYGEASLRSIMSWKGGLNLLLEREITV